MSILKVVSLRNVWGEKQFDLTFHPDVNFLIGANGSGKTTVINLIAAVLTADYEALDRIPFSAISCGLQAHGAHHFTVTAIRPESPTHGGPIEYQITVNGKETSFQLWPPMQSPLRYSVRAGSRSLAQSEQLNLRLSELVNLRWLSVHRTPAKSRVEERTSFESTVDRRLNNLSNRMVRYFSKQAARREAETQSFLRQLFIALVYTGTDDELVPASTLSEIDKLEEALVDIFEQFDLGHPAILKKLNHHFQLAKQAASKSSYKASELAALIGLQSMKRVVQAWNDSLDKQTEIFRPQGEFLETLNSMLRNKRLVVNQRNELEAVLTTDKHLSLIELSSGEKQLLIILGEALLQEKEQFIYIADEPELSLHVSWQERLTATLRKINPNAQIIFATHSPDIVSEYGDRVINMESL